MSLWILSSHLVALFNCWALGQTVNSWKKCLTQYCTKYFTDIRILVSVCIIHNWLRAHCTYSYEYRDRIFNKFRESCFSCIYPLYIMYILSCFNFFSWMYRVFIKIRVFVFLVIFNYCLKKHKYNAFYSYINFCIILSF